MRFQKQTIAHDPFSGTVGNCYQAALASLLGMNIDDVPHFYEDAKSDKPEHDFETAVEEWIDNWLHDRGLMRIELMMSGGTVSEALAILLVMVPVTYPILLSGLAPNGMPHVVIAQGGSIVWDPAIGDGGLKGPFKDGAWFVEIIVRPIEEDES